MSFQEKIQNKWDQKKFLCVGLDPVFEKLPKHLHRKSPKQAFTQFLTQIIDRTADIVCAFKPNSAFYEAYGAHGWEALEYVCSYIQAAYPDIPIILDYKRGDIGNTNHGYVESAFEQLQVDAVTVQPYAGKESLTPFLEQTDSFIFVLVKTSNPGSGEFQSLELDDKKLYEVVAEHVAVEWNTKGNCGVVVGATYSEELKRVRTIIGDMPILIPGLGSQGGTVKDIVTNALDSKKQGIIVNSSREVLYASNGTDFAEAARSKAQLLSDTITKEL
jgi:orotidine-5'-phosphate decarboxylase